MAERINHQRITRLSHIFPLLYHPSPGSKYNRYCLSLKQTNCSKTLTAILIWKARSRLVSRWNKDNRKKVLKAQMKNRKSEADIHIVED